MAKINVFLIMLFISLIPLQAQNPENECIQFQKIMVSEGKSGKVLLQSLEKALLKLFDSAAVQDKDNNSMMIKCNFLVYNSLIGKVGNPAGKIDFILSVEVKDEKYRYKADRFFFTPFKRDRYGRFSLTDEQPIQVSESRYLNNKSLFRKINSQCSDYLERLEVALIDHLALSKNRLIEW